MEKALYTLIKQELKFSVCLELTYMQYSVTNTQITMLVKNIHAAWDTQILLTLVITTHLAMVTSTVLFVVDVKCGSHIDELSCCLQASKRTVR